MRNFTESAQAQMDDLLFRICEELQLPPARHDQAVQRYQTVCQWLEADGSMVASFFPGIYSQGSMKIGTTVRPIGQNEHDLDFVCEFNVPASAFPTPLHILRLLEARLREHKIYDGILELKNRCVRLNYANEFHLDILPACPDPDAGLYCLVVPDRESRCWKPSNPKGYAAWFEERCAIRAVLSEAAILSKAEPIPDQEPTDEKAPLKHAVQLLKRWRDLYYQAYPDVAPISMVLTTLAAHHYEGQASVSDALSGIITGIIANIETSIPRVYVPNPANPQEDLSERWDDPVAYAAFVRGMKEFSNDWNDMLAQRGLSNVSTALEGLFGEPVIVALREQARTVQHLRDQS